MNKSLALAHFQTSFQFITHQNERFSYLEGAYLALIGGCDWVQLRMKGATDEEVEPIARKLKLACEGAGATFILDDRVELVKKLQIDGVHLGKNDMPVDDAVSSWVMNSLSEEQPIHLMIFVVCMNRGLTISVAVRSAILLPRRNSLRCWV